MNEKVKVAIIGPGNIGTDLLFKMKRSKNMELEYVVGVKDSQGIATAKEHNIKTTTEGLEDILDEAKDVKIFFDCTGAKPHLHHAKLLKERGKIAIDLTPAAVGPYVVPSVNLKDDMLNVDNFNLVTCGGQATIPVVAAVNEVADVEYVEIVSSISSKSAGAGTRQNIDEFTKTTKKALEEVGGADEAKVIIVLNPAEPPIHMRNTIYAKVKNPDIDVIKKAINDMVEKIRVYIPGYKILMEPIIQDNLVTTMIEVEGLGDYLPAYAGNLDIINSAAIQIGEVIAEKLIKGE